MGRYGLVTAWRLAGWPTSRSPSSVNATIEGVVRPPSEFSITLGVLPSITATQELVVPRSMPIAFVITELPSATAGRHSSIRTAHPARRHEPTPALGAVHRCTPVTRQDHHGRQGRTPSMRL